MRERSKKRLGEILVDLGALSKEQLQQVLEAQKKENLPLGQLLINRSLISEEHLTAALSQQLKIPYLPLQNYSISSDVFAVIDEEFCRHNSLIPFDRDEKCIFIAMADPLNDAAIETLERQTKLKPQIFISTSQEIFNTLDLLITSWVQKKELKKAG